MHKEYHNPDRRNVILDADTIIAALAGLDPADQDRVKRALDALLAASKQSAVVERRPYLDGVLQLETRRNPKTGSGREYWYFKYRHDGKQSTMYVGKTDNPERIVDEKIGKGRQHG